MIFSYFYSEIKPFVIASDSIAAIGAEWGLTFTLLLSLIITVANYEESLSYTLQSFIGLVMIGVNVGTMIFTIYVSIWNEDNKQKNALDKFKKSRIRKRSSSSTSSSSNLARRQQRKRGTNETLLTKVRLSFKKSFRKSGVGGTIFDEGGGGGGGGDVENPAIVELTEMKESEGGGGRGGRGGECDERRSSSLFHRSTKSRLKSKARDSDDESDSDDSVNETQAAEGGRNTRTTREVIIRSNPHDSMQL